MAEKKAKDFNKMLRDSKDMPKIETVTDPGTIKRNGGERMVIAPPADYDELMKKVPEGKVVTVPQIRKTLARRYSADFTCPLTAGIFISIAAQASEQRGVDKTPYWRTLKAEGELNEKYPGGVGGQKEKLEAEGHSIAQRGRTKIRMFVENYEDALYDIDKDEKE